MRHLVEGARRRLTAGGGARLSGIRKTTAAEGSLGAVEGGTDDADARGARPGFVPGIGAGIAS